MSDIIVTIEESGAITATVSEGDIVVLLPQGEAGPQGPAGPEGGSAVTYQAGENLSTGRVVVIDGAEAFYFQPDDLTHVGRAFGVTVTSATSGNDVDIQVSGIVQDAAFGFAEDMLLWVDADGEIVDTQPSGTSIIQKAGVSAEDKKMRIDLSICILKQ